jgi:ribosomal protein L24
VTPVFKKDDYVEFLHGFLRGQRGVVLEVCAPATRMEATFPVCIQRDTWEDTNSDGKILAAPSELKLIDAIERLGRLA